MKTRVLLLAAVACLPFTCHDVEAAEAAKPVFRAVRAAKAPVVDGDLSDAAWQSAPEITGFTQHDPDDGKPATQKTVVKVVYDDAALYVGATLYDTRPVTTLLGRRDINLQSDWFRINIDSLHDGLSGAGFWVNPSNVQCDMVLYNDIYDDWSWDAVWASAAKIVPGVGWVVEARIPYSQLRFHDQEVQTWGVNFARRIASNAEVDRLVNTPKSETGFVSRFATLEGIAGVRGGRAFELMPYGVARSDVRSRFDRSDPFARSMRNKMAAGMDLKYGLTSNLTLTGTINPDFGQVEVDPAVVNLGQFETFFPEKRPFFTEGVQMFRFGQAPAHSRFNFNYYPPQFFYSRRIGRTPQGSDNLDADYVAAPGETTILGAAKVTGKLGGGWSVGVLDAVTDKETAAALTNDAFRREAVEPRTNYLVARTMKEFDGGNSRLGGMVTSVNRSLPGELSYLRANAYTAGLDGYKMFHKKDWLFEWQAGMTRVDGTSDAIDRTQRGAAHGYNRPDADYLHYDPTRTALDGYGGRVMLAKQTGRWRPNVQVQTYSPGFDVNDIGYMRRVDETAAHVVMQYINDSTTKYTRDVEIWAGKYNNYNYGGDTIADGVYGNWYVQLKNYWYLFGSGGVDARVIDDRRTRGGPAGISPSSHDVSFGVGSDSRKKLSFEASGEDFEISDGGYSHSATVSVNYRPSTNVRLSIAPSYNREHYASQYVTQFADANAKAMFGNRYVFAQIDQRTVDIGTRAEWTVSSRLSFQLYMQPFIATGHYHDFKELVRPRSTDYVAYGGPVDNPDFNLRSVRGSAVVRWEFRPGSALYVVWNENRADVQPFGDFRFRRDVRAIPNAPSNDVFLVKVAYWLPM